MPVLAAALVVGLAAAFAGAVGAVGRDRIRARIVPAALRPAAGRARSRWSRVAPRATSARDARRYEDALPEAIEHLAAGLRAGASVPQAFAAAGGRAGAEVGADLDAVVRAVERGVALEGALEEWCRRRPLPAVTLTASALQLGARVGGRQARALDAVGDAIRERIALRREVRALSSQARASAWVMSVTPLAFAAVASTLDPRVAGVLLASPLGWACLAGGATLDGAAACWMARIIGGRA
jgi:tight adherence protein B